ncbi:hypothetical protein [Pontibacter oryzae]|nr:hypothetical protein [Pontibacter oryzae]
MILCLAFFSCQQQETADDATATAKSPAPEIATSTSEPRPAPAFYVVPEKLLEKRVWICEDGSADVFHLKHDCPILIQCKGKGSFRNLLLPKAIEDYGRYNCQECSKELDHIFDEETVRTIKG